MLCWGLFKLVEATYTIYIQNHTQSYIIIHYYTQSYILRRATKFMGYTKFKLVGFGLMGKGLAPGG